MCEAIRVKTYNGIAAMHETSIEAFTGLMAKLLPEGWVCVTTIPFMAVNDAPGVPTRVRSYWWLQPS